MAAQQTRCSMDETKQWLFQVTIRSEIVLRTDIRRDRLHVASKDAYLLQNWQQVGRQVDCHSWPHCSDLHDVGPYVPSHCRCCLHTLHIDHPQPSLQSITTPEMILSSAMLIPSQNVRFEVFTAVVLRNQVFLNMMLYQVSGSRHLKDRFHI